MKNLRVRFNVYDRKYETFISTNVFNLTTTNKSQLIMELSNIVHFLERQEHKPVYIRMFLDFEKTQSLELFNG